MPSDSELCIPVKVRSFVSARYRHTSGPKHCPQASAARPGSSERGTARPCGPAGDRAGQSRRGPRSSRSRSRSRRRDHRALRTEGGGGPGSVLKAGRNLWLGYLVNAETIRDGCAGVKPELPWAPSDRLQRQAWISQLTEGGRHDKRPGYVDTTRARNGKPSNENVSAHYWHFPQSGHHDGFAHEARAAEICHGP